MTYKELKEKLNTLSEEQLNQTATVFINDEEVSCEIDSWEEQQEDIYWMDGDCYGGLQNVQEQISKMNESEPEDDKISIEHFHKVPKGFFSLEAIK